MVFVGALKVTRFPRVQDAPSLHSPEMSMRKVDCRSLRVSMPKKSLPRTTDEESREVVVESRYAVRSQL
jgi:hypothetical protein